jgi:hypothetical protein
VANDLRIDVEGLAQFRAALRRVDADFARQVKVANVDAAEMVVARARANAAAQGGVAAKAARSLRAAQTAAAAKVRLGSAADPYALGAEFGGGSRPQTRQFKPWRGSGGGAGYFLYPAIRASRSQIVGLYAAALARIAREAGFR